jgi:hypothetical protein
LLLLSEAGKKSEGEGCDCDENFFHMILKFVDVCSESFCDD